MKTIKKTISVVLAVMMIMSAFAAFSFSADAAEANTITVKSNLADPVSYNYDAQSKQVTVTYCLQSDNMIVAAQAYCAYDGDVLSLASTNKRSTCLPVLSDGSSVLNLNVNKDNKVLFNASCLDLYDFRTKNTFLTLTFDIIGTGAANIDLTVEVITATTANNFDEMETATDINLVTPNKIQADKFNFSQSANVIQGSTPTPDIPNDGYYVLSDDFNLKLSACGTNKVRGDIALQPGTYKIKLDNYGTLLGYSKTVTDATNGLTFSSKYSSYTTLVATGGVYTFQVNTDTNTLVIKHNSNLPANYLIGDIHSILKPVAGKPLAIGSSYLEAGTYKFKISDDTVELGYGSTITDSSAGKSLSFNSKYKSDCTLIATGGTYTFTYNTDTKRLIVGYTPVKDEAVDDVHISGDFDLVLDDNDGNSNVAVATKTLAEGTYSFKVYNYGVAYTLGEKIVDSGLKNLSNAYKSNVTLIATGGSYTFSFNKTTGQLIVKKA